MPVIKSAEKKMRQDEKRYVRNNRRSVQIKQAVRKFDDGVKAGKDTKELSELLRNAYKAIDLGTKNHLYHEKNAARKKSGLAKKMPAATK